jgi:ApaG protein
MPTTYAIDVHPHPEYQPEHSDPTNGVYVFAYTITLTNTGSVGAKLLSRYWRITDGNNEVQEVRGKGVVGEQPFLAPGASYSYRSGCPLPTPIGTMQGSYLMEAEDGTQFQAEIPEFALAVPSALH